MSISNYTELQTAIGSYLHRSDLTSQIPDFISIAEGKINRVSKLIHQETTDDVTMSTSNDYNTLPTGFLELIDFYYTDTLDQLQQIPMKTLGGLRTLSTSPTRPFAFSVSDKMYYDATPDSAYTLKRTYVKGWDIAGDDTNWLLTNHLGAYLYGALAEASPYIKNDARILTWKSLSQEILDELKTLSAKSRKATLRTEMTGGGAYNIYTDG